MPQIIEPEQKAAQGSASLRPQILPDYIATVPFAPSDVELLHAPVRNGFSETINFAAHRVPAKDVFRIYKLHVTTRRFPTNPVAGSTVTTEKTLLGRPKERTVEFSYTETLEELAKLKDNMIGKGWKEVLPDENDMPERSRRSVSIRPPSRTNGVPEPEKLSA